jgi:uncharacterized protein
MIADRRPLQATKARSPLASCEIKLAGAPLAKVSLDGVFEGYASLFGVVDLGRDLVAPGAFRDSISRKPLTAVKLLWQHDPTAPLGTWEEIREDGTGLRVRGKLNLSVAKAREVHALMRSGAVDGLSIGFRTERSRKDASTGVRRLEKLDLWEISIVTFPMLPGARVSAVKQTRRRRPAARELGEAIRAAARRIAA